MPSIQVGSIVTNTRQPAWGPGRVFSFAGECVLVGFRDRPLDDRFVRVTPQCLELAGIQSDPVLDGLSVRFDSHCRVIATPRARRREDAGGRVPAALTDDQAFARFLAVYPGGFADDAYLQAERSWKWQKHLEWNELFPGDTLRELAQADPAEAGRRLLKVVQTERAPLLTPRFELVALKEGLSHEASRRYFLALADYVEAGAASHGPFDDLREALTALPTDRSSSRIGTWPILTVVPFLARPDQHMFLKPTPACEAARLLGYDLLYSSRLRWDTYRRLLDLAAHLFRFLQPKGAQDYIDVQSFLWVLVRGVERTGVPAPSPAEPATPSEAPQASSEA